MNPDDLGDRLAQAFRGAVQQVDAPSSLDLLLARRETPAPRRRTGLVAACACVLVLSLGGLVALSRRDRADPGPSADPITAVLGRWLLSGVQVDGRPLDLPTRDVVWSFTDSPCATTLMDDDCENPALVGSDGCNNFRRTLAKEIVNEQLSWGDEYASTLAGCLNQFDEVMTRFMGSDGFGLSAHGDSLRLSANGVDLSFIPTAAEAPVIGGTGSAVPIGQPGTTAPTG